MHGAVRQDIRTRFTGQRGLAQLTVPYLRAGASQGMREGAGEGAGAGAGAGEGARVAYGRVPEFFAETPECRPLKRAGRLR